MNRIYPEGSLVIVRPVSCMGVGWSPSTGQRVTIERRNARDRLETAVREVELTHERILLWPRSLHHAFQDPWWLERDPAGPFTDGIAITGLVVGSLVAEGV